MWRKLSFTLTKTSANVLMEDYAKPLHLFVQDEITHEGKKKRHCVHRAPSITKSFREKSKEGHTKYCFTKWNFQQTKKKKGKGPNFLEGLVCWMWRNMWQTGRHISQHHMQPSGALRLSKVLTRDTELMIDVIWGETSNSRSTKLSENENKVERRRWYHDK